MKTTSKETKRLILALRDLGCTYKEIQKTLNVSSKTISKVTHETLHYATMEDLLMDMYNKIALDKIIESHKEEVKTKGAFFDPKLVDAIYEGEGFGWSVEEEMKDKIQESIEEDKEERSKFISDSMQEEEIDMIDSGLQYVKIETTTLDKALEEQAKEMLEQEILDLRRLNFSLVKEVQDLQGMLEIEYEVASTLEHTIEMQKNWIFENKPYKNKDLEEDKYFVYKFVLILLAITVSFFGLLYLAAKFINQ